MTNQSGRVQQLPAVAPRCLKCDPTLVARGMFFKFSYIADADGGSPRAATARAVICAPNGAGR